MKNPLVPIFQTLKRASIEFSNCDTWGIDNPVVVKQNAEKQDILWVAVDDNEGPVVLDVADMHLLLKQGHLAKPGKPVKKNFKGRSRLAVGVHLDGTVGKIHSKTAGANKEAHLLQEIETLKKQLEFTQDEVQRLSQVAEIMATVRDEHAKKRPIKPMGLDKLMSKFGTPKGEEPGEIPTLLLSDWHYGESVDSAQIGGLNHYNIRVANERIDRLLANTLDELLIKRAGTRYEGFCLALAGDFISGSIHEELARSNEVTVAEAIAGVTNKLAEFILELACNFPFVYVPAVVGNHGRADRYPSVKNAVRNNWEWLGYIQVKSLVEKALCNQTNNVQFDIADALDLNYKLYNVRYLLTHGDQFEGKKDSDAFVSNLLKSVTQKQLRVSKLGNRDVNSFDYMICGHFHTYTTVGQCIVNGSLKGPDEFAWRNNYVLEAPKQALWITHPVKGITAHIPIACDDWELDERAYAPPVTPSR